jgi:competence protein ComGC
MAPGTNMTEKNGIEKPGIDKSGEIYHVPSVVPVMRVLNLVLILVALLMFLNLAGLFSFLGGYFVLLMIAIVGFSIMILATLIFRYIYRNDERAKKRLPSLGWQFLAVIFIIIMGGAFPSASRTISMNNEKKCEENLKKLGRSVERYAAEKERLPDSFEQLIQEKFLDDIPSVGKSAYLYRIDTTNGKSSFVLICPDPGKLSKARGFLPAKKCKDIRYIQGRGLVVETE